MKLFYPFLLVLFIFGACRPKSSKTRDTTNNSSSSSTGWSQQDKDKYADWCKATVHKNTEANCNCSLDAAQKIFSSYDEANRIINSESSEGMSDADKKKHSDFENAMENCGEKSNGENKSYNSNTQSGWSQQDKEAVLNEFCNNTHKGREECACYLEVAVKIFSSYNEWKRIMIDNAFSENSLSADDRQKMDEATKMFYDCKTKYAE